MRRGFVLGLPIWKFLPGKSISRQEKIWKMTLAPYKKFLVTPLMRWYQCSSKRARDWPFDISICNVLLVLYEMWREFKKHGSSADHNVRTCCRAENNSQPLPTNYQTMTSHEAWYRDLIVIGFIDKISLKDFNSALSRLIWSSISWK